MRKNDFVKNVTAKVRDEEKFAVTLKETEAYLNAIRDAVIEAMQAGEEVAIPGFVKFSVADQNARIARNPQTGKEINVPAKKKVKVKILEKLKSSVR